MHGLLSIIFATALFCSACNAATDNSAAGGPCTYQYDTVPAVILSIATVDSANYNLSLVINRKGTVRDSTDYYTLSGRYVNDKELKAKKINLDDTVIFVEGSIVSGSCNPAVSRLVLQHYK